VSFFLVFVAIVLIGAAVLAGTDALSRIFRKAGAGSGINDGFDDPVASLPPVLLPEHARPEDVDQVRFALGLRGYRMDQVDQVLDDLRDQLAARDREIERLNNELLRERAAAEDGQ
jgi:DivIVA domain-containing protein